MKILELFSGYGTASFALKRLGISYEIVGYSDIDKYANQCFKQNHCPEDIENKKQLGDVKIINPKDLEDFDLLTGGFPCQAFSLAGKGLGELDPRGTLFYEIIRIAEVKKPRFMLLENVKGLTNKSHRPTFEKILSELARIGYKVHWKVLNTKDYGIPQNRERVWFVCFREQSDYDKFTFPEKEELKIFIKDILEPEVDKKYYLSSLLQERFRKYLEDKQNEVHSLYPRSSTTGKGGTGHLSKNDGTSYAVDTGNCQAIKDNLVYVRKGFDSRDKFRESELSQTILTGGYNIPMVQAQISNCSPREVGFKDISPCLAARDYKDPKIVSNTITTAVGRIGHSKEELGYIENNMNCGQLRRLTPKECFRLMGFLNDEINLEGLSDTQKYKLAGNGQDVNIVTKIFKEMFKNAS
jgi:DNA-cytosine methyltransferase